MSDAKAARQVLDLVARHFAELDQEAVSWVYAAAFKVFREEALAEAKRHCEAEEKRGRK